MKKNNIYQWLYASVIVMTSLFLWSACGEDDTYGKPDVDNTPHLTVKDINPKVTKPGNMVVISGRDMNLVKAVRFGETDQFVVLREAFDKVSTNSTQLVLTIPEDAPIGTVYVISNEDIALEAGTLTAMMPVVEKIEPVSALLPGD
ncbi:MAG: hypothetical protein LBN18_04275, partial [Dysgonamonadaceae bacterium]|nr:hypothetical protein [Dysgonamonadaceae bacterium]